MYTLHSLHGQFIGCHFFITLLKALIVLNSLNSGCTIFQIFGPKYDMLSVPLYTLQTFGMAN